MQSTLDFETTIQSLDQTRAELENIAAITDAASYPLFTTLQKINGKLWKSLPEALHRSAWIHLEHVLLKLDVYALEETAKYDILRNLVTNNTHLNHNRISNAVFLRHMILKTNAAQSNLRFERITRGKSDLIMNPDTIINYDTLFNNSNEVSFESNSAVLDNGTQILVEWIRYGHHWEGDIMDEMIRRVGNIAVFLHETAGTHRLPRLFPCLGFFHAPSRHGFGLVFETPAMTDKQTVSSLKQIIENSTRSDANVTNTLPDLSQRLKLALILAESIFELHLATFLHKSISSMNIVCLANGTHQYSIEDPYLIGFNHIRPNDPKAFTEGPPPGRIHRFYHHPDYSVDHMRQGTRFKLAYDYYSLGLVLLEIGLWDNVVSNTREKSALQLKEKLLKRWVPHLGFRTGKTYQKIVVRCLEGRIGRDVDDDTTILEQFELLVVQPLRDLKV